MKLYPITTTSLQLLESGQFINRLITDFENDGIDPRKDSDFEILFQSLKAQSPIYNDALLQVKAKAETESILVLDQWRDKKTSTVRRAISVYEFSEDAREIMAYQEAKTIMKKYTMIERANYEAQTLGTDKLIKELREAKYDAMNVLKMEEHVLNLEKSNNNFKQMFDNRSSATISTETFDTKTLRKNIFTTYKDLAEYVLVMAKRKKTPFFIDTLDVINNGRKYFADILAKRSGNGNVQ